TLMDDKTDQRAHQELVKAAKERWNITGNPEDIWNEFEHHLRKFESTISTRWISGKQRFVDAMETLIKRKLNPVERYWFLCEYRRFHKLYVRLFPETPTVLRFVKNRFVHVGLISNIDDDYLYFELERTGILEFFDSITTSSGVGFGKPNAKIFDIALKKASMKSEDSFYVGNSIKYDVKPANQVGMQTILISEKDCDEADYVIPNIGGLINLFNPL
ncbi:MAG TPA: hypothetical protein EYP60_03415, partial [bacterium (Candidatus Stahlbacteria)]|nr:hypothetical protein [Candidatus Stahlbacteria bacterium]